MTKHEKMICAVIEALEATEAYRDIYLVLLKQTGDKQQAIDALKFIKQIVEESGIEMIKHKRSAA